MIVRQLYELILNKLLRLHIMSFQIVWLPCQMIIRSEFGILKNYNKLTSSHIHLQIHAYACQATLMVCILQLGLNLVLWELSTFKMSQSSRKSNIIATQSCMLSTVLMAVFLQYCKKRWTCYIPHSILTNLLSTYVYKSQASTNPVLFLKILKQLLW